MKKYSDYIQIDNNFIPVFSKNWDEKYPDRWQAFFPHDTFKTILTDLISSLEMNSNESRKSLWISGAYGTGKTYASFAIKHILEDSIENVASYFEKQKISQSLLNRFIGIKENKKVLVVHRSSSSGIIGDNKLFGAIQESIKNSLRNNGYSYTGAKSFYDNVLNILKDENSSFNFKGAFNKYRGSFTEYSNTEEIIKDLEELGIDDGVLDLLERVVEVADKEGFNWAKSAEDISRWIEDIMKINNIYSIVFIWDEFTEYFTNNQNTTTGLQELAQLSFTVPFYFLLITHKTHSQFIFDTETRKRLEARFKMNKIEMADATAFMLMRNAIKYLPEFENDRNILWTNVERMVDKTIIKFAPEIRTDELKGLLPLHPYSAYMLKVISSLVSSNQRTMFQFLSGEIGESNKHNFRWFIENNNISNWAYLTCDYIWDYFFYDDNVDIDEGIRNVISHFNTYKNHCKDEKEERILKMVLLLVAMNQKSGGERGRGLSSLLRPTLSNVIVAFEGTSLHDSIRMKLEKFVSDGVIGGIPEGNDILYVTQSKTIDEESYKKIEDRIKPMLSFEKIIDNPEYKINEKFELSGYAKVRFDILCATATDFRKKIEKIKEIPDNKVPIMFLYAKTEEDSYKIREVITKIYEMVERDIIILDLSSQPLTNMYYDEFFKLKVLQEYWFSGQKDTSQAKLYENKAKDIISEWKSKIEKTTIILYSGKDKTLKILGSANFRKNINEINNQLYIYGIETISEHPKIFAEQGFKEIASIMGMDLQPIQGGNYSCLIQIKSRLEKDNIWNNNRYYEINPSHSISRAKNEIEKVIKEKFDSENTVYFSDIWKILRNKPFGYLNCMGTVFLLGFLLKEYANGSYYKTDGLNTVPLTHDGLADIINGLVKNNSKINEIKMVKMTPEQEMFCKESGKIFKIPADRQNTITDIKHGIKNFLQNVDFPLWTIKNYISEEVNAEYKDELIMLADLFCELISTDKIEGKDESKIATEIADYFLKKSYLQEKLQEIINSENLKTGMDFYIFEYKNELRAVIRKLEITDKSYLKNLKSKLTNDSKWLWQKGEIDKKIDEMYNEYRLIKEINGVTIKKSHTLNEAILEIKEKIKFIKIPYSFFEESIKEFKEIFELLINIYKIGNIKDTEKEQLLKELDTNAENFKLIYENQFEIFEKNVIEIFSNDITEDEIKYIYEKLDIDSILVDINLYQQNINKYLQEYRKNKKYNVLLKKWNEVSGYSSPREWSEKNKISILCIFTDNIEEAKKTFDLLNSKNINYSESQIEMAINFLDLNKTIEKIKDKDNAMKIFKLFILGEYLTMIDSLEIINDILIKKIGNDIYNWYLKKSEIDRIVKEFAYEFYKDSFYEKVFEKIDVLSPEKAKEYLKELIKNNPIVGINIMKN